MKNKNFIKVFIVILFSFFLFPSLISAVDTKVDINNTLIWGNHPDWPKEYYTKGYGKRKTMYLAKFTLNDGSGRQVFCIEPGAYFKSNTTQKGYTSGTNLPTLNGWTINETKQDNLNKVLSCYYKNNNNATIATQAIVWELITGERTGINNSDAKNILSGHYAPQQKVDNSLYDVITNTKVSPKNKNGDYTGTIYGHYQSILRCAARFNAKPSWGYGLTDDKEYRELSNYNDATQTFSATFSHGTFVSDLFKYYTFEINGKPATCKASKGATVDGVTCKCDNEKCSFSTKEVKTTDNPIKVTFNYTFKSNASTELNSDPVKYYTKTTFQTLMIGGSKTKTFYLNLYTGEKPKYQLKIKKEDNAGKPISGVTFNICSDIKCSKVIATTPATNQNGETTYQKITAIGDYYVQEKKGVDGYVTTGDIKKVTITASNKVGTASYATTTYKNKDMHLIMNKRTVDADGKITTLKDDYCTVKSCPSENNRENGPVFTLTKSGKKVCVTETSPGNYTYHSAADTCPQGTTDAIKTCNGKFDIKNITSGTYVVKEVATVCGMTLPVNTTKTITVKENAETTTITMDNGVSGVVFNKIDENGNLLDGGIFALQKKENGVYKDLLLKQTGDGIYVYEDGLTENSNGATYTLETSEGTINVKGLLVGEYRFVEKQSPEDYEPIKDKDSTATFVVSDKGISKDGKDASNYYEVSLVNHKIRTEGSYDSAELIVTIITGRKVINYALVIGGLSLLLVLFIIIRKKIKK